MKKRLTIIVPALFAMASICLLQPVKAAEEEEKSSEVKTENTEKSESAEKTDKSAEKKSAKSTLSSADKKFMKTAAKGGMMEVAGGKAASKQAQSREVKQFGARMVTDHSKANDELKAIASKKGVSLPNDEPSMAFKNDKDYMAMMVKDHEKDLSEFQEEAKNGSDPDVKRFANKTSKVIAGHLSMAQNIDKNLQQQKKPFTPR
jgi:putative membrane protein